MIAQDYRRIAGVHSLVGAVIRQAVIDYKTEYQERSGEHPAYRFLYAAGLLQSADSIFEAIITSNPDAYYEAKRIAHD